LGDEDPGRACSAFEEAEGGTQEEQDRGREEPDAELRKRKKKETTEQKKTIQGNESRKSKPTAPLLLHTTATCQLGRRDEKKSSLG
jgi:hypothetical protein